MSDDVDLKGAFRAVKDTYDGTSPDADLTLQRALFASRRSSSRRKVTQWVVIPIAAALFASTAWAGVTGRLAPVVDSVREVFHAEDTPSEPAAPSMHANAKEPHHQSTEANLALEPSAADAPAVESSANIDTTRAANADRADTSANADRADTSANANRADTSANADRADTSADADRADTTAHSPSANATADHAHANAASANTSAHSPSANADRANTSTSAGATSGESEKTARVSGSTPASANAASSKNGESSPLAPGAAASKKDGVTAPLAPVAATSNKDNESAAPVAAASKKDATAAPSREAQLFAEANRIHFNEHDPARALVAWDRYLAFAPNGTFAPEARYNRTLTLIRLGRTAEARTELEKFASGTYRRTEARSLLDALARDAGP